MECPSSPSTVAPPPNAACNGVLLGTDLPPLCAPGQAQRQAQQLKVSDGMAFSRWGIWRKYKDS